ncbi:MAG: hypothetical protein LBK70_01765 [Clostridiales bacterium]|jgi:hypothetical protein|nr:hypothetical protein [Clostridiales bacterium]
MDNKNPNALVCFLLTFFLGWIGSFIVNAAGLNPPGWKSRTGAYIGFGILTCGIYSLVASICNFAFDATKSSNIGYYKV